AGVAVGVEVPLRHVELVADGARVDDGRAADELPGLLGDVVPLDLVDERVAGVDERREGVRVCERAPERGETARDVRRVRLERTGLEIERQGERREQRRAHGSITTFSARPDAASAKASRAAASSKRASMRAAVSTRPSRISASASEQSAFVFAVVPVTRSSL